MLLAHAGEVVTREELQKRLWPSDTFVDFEHSLNAAIKRLRAALGDSAEAPRFVETLARKGYRFVAPLSHPAEGPRNGPGKSQRGAVLFWQRSIRRGCLGVWAEAGWSWGTWWAAGLPQVRSIFGRAPARQPFP